jgi:urea transporter
VETLRTGIAALLRMYAGIFFSDSLAVGALVLLATALVPLSGFLGLVAVASAAATASALGLVSETSPPSTFAYSALFLGLGASHTFATFPAAFALATLGAAASAVSTAAISGWMQRIGLPALSLPFMLIYCCAISAGVSLDASWTQPTAALGINALSWWPAPVRMFLEALGALLFTPRIDVGLVVLACLCLRGGHAPQLALLAFGITKLAELVLPLEPLGMRFGALLNAIFSAIVLGAGWYAPSVWSYARAVFGVILSILLTLTLTEPLARLGLGPVALPFNLSIFAILLITQQRMRSSAALPAV